MAEKIYAIPVNDAFSRDCECPVCVMYRDIEADEISFTLGPSYMDDRFRIQTDETGFCERHMQQLYDRNNRLGLALMMKTHMDKLIKDTEAIVSNPLKAGLFKKKNAALSEHLGRIERSCFVCKRLEEMFERYIYTILYLYRTDESFREKYAKCKGFCTGHYKRLIDEAPRELTGKQLDGFTKVTTSLYIENMKRVRDDVEWFINKFDYNYHDAPWKNAKDACPRGMNKLNGILPPEEIKKEKAYD